MSTHASLAEELFRKGYNCSQAVFAAFCDETGMEFETALKLASSFGGGMGRMREVCGAVSGMFLVIGTLYGYSDPMDKTAKAEHYKLVQALAEEFKSENNSIICRELLKPAANSDSAAPEDRTEAYYKKRPCAELVRQAAEIVEEYILNKNAEVKERC